jgi:hypothetical protein
MILPDSLLNVSAALALACASTALASSPVPLSISPPDPQGWIGLKSSAEKPDTVFTLRASSNLTNWIPIAIIHNGPLNFLDASAPQFQHRFYAAAHAPMTAADDWKNQVVLPDDPFASFAWESGADQIGWIKFAIVLDEPNRVYYQDSRKYPFHYDFAVVRLPTFQGLSRQAFDQVSLRTNQQQVVLGAVLFPLGSSSTEYGIQFVGLDPYPRELAARWFEIVRSTVAGGGGAQAFYMPVFEQSSSVWSDQLFFESKGIRVSAVDRWITSDVCYSEGWALGRLVYVPGHEIEAAYADGRLGPGDILLTDNVPAEVPFVAGIISLRPSTPNSHVAILAKSHGIPFVYLASAAERERAQQLAGGEIMFRARQFWDMSEIRFAGTDKQMDPALREEILALKAHEALDVTPKATFGSYATLVDDLQPADIQYFGGKAANFGVLRRSIPNNSPHAIAFSFDLWDEFMSQTMGGGKSLEAEINERLARHVYPPDIAALKQDLAAIRDRITRDTRFTAAQQAEVLDALSIFDPLRRIRFRSSTNVEDSEKFSGAGLYDSYSGCLADDLDDDEEGPSHCDPTRKNERGVFRAIQRVYASFYNDNAFLERLRLKVDESQAGMAMLVHYSFPDEIELANGVAALRIHGNYVEGELVTQAGAVSVTNPDSTARPEVVTVSRFGVGGTWFNVKQHSALVPLGARVLEWEAEYRQLFTLLNEAAQAYQQAVPGKDSYYLDFEYKKIEPGELSIKQVREIPTPSSKPIVPFLLNEPSQFCLFQGEFGDIFGNHRLKSRWHFATKNMRLTQPNLGGSFYSDTQIEYAQGAEVYRLTNGIAAWPGASHGVDGEAVTDRWTVGTGNDQRRYTLETTIKREVRSPESPLLTHVDFVKVLRVEYAAPQHSFDWQGQPGVTTSDTARLWECPLVTSESLLQERVVEVEGVTIQTSFFWPEHPRGITAGYTAPLQQWVETRLEGLISEPIVLRGYYSQTYRPWHHNFAEEFIFEPQLEENLPPAQLEALAAANIQLLHVYWDGERNRITVLGQDGAFRVLPGKSAGKEP